MPVIYRVLIVDDHEQWRRQLRSMLAGTRRWQLVGEAADGLEAIQNVSASQPDVILLDVELTGLNGIETARRILTVSPDSRVLFISAHRSWDIAEIALGTGARGYILKSDAGHELLPAMSAVADGGWFISGALVGRAPQRTKGPHSGHRPRLHEATFYSDRHLLLAGIARFSETVLKNGKTTIVGTLSSHRNEFHEHLGACGIDADHAIHEGRYLPMDLDEMLSAVMVDGRPDDIRFWKTAISYVMRAARASRQNSLRIAICGEGCAVLVEDGRLDAAVELEHLWDEFAKACNVAVFCGHLTKAARRDDDEVIRRIGAEHSAVHFL